MSNIDWDIDNQKRATSAGSSETAPRRRGSKLDLLKAAWNDLTDRGPRDSAAQHRRPLAAFLRRHLAVVALVVLLVFPLAAILLAYITRPATGTAGEAEAGLSASLTDSGSGEKKTKPAPGKPMMPVSQAPPPSVIHQPPVSTLEPQAPAGMASVPARPLPAAPTVPSAAPNTPPPAVPGFGTRPPYTPVVYTARHDKVFGEGCSGQLTLDSSGLFFRCSDDPRASVQVALADIEAVDGNGVRLISGKKYHFSIAGMGKNNAEQLFSNWLQRVR